MTVIDLNSDLGEHVGSTLDEQIMPFLSSCNVACGGHAGDKSSVKESILLAKKHSVAIGAHPSYPDWEHFGRSIIEISDKELKQSLITQIQLVRDSCVDLGAQLHHIKPHGALYNEVAKNEQLSSMICEVLKKVDPKVKLYGLAHSLTEKVAKANNIEFIAEGFADRKYEPDRSLMSRKKDGAVITNEGTVLKQVEEMTLNKRIFSDKWTSIDVQTICLHSDTQGAVNLAKKIKNHLEKKGVQIVAV